MHTHKPKNSIYLSQHPHCICTHDALSCLFLNSPTLTVSVTFSANLSDCCLSWTRQKELSMSSGWGISPNWSSASNCATLSTTTERWALTWVCLLSWNHPHCSPVNPFLNLKIYCGVFAAGEGSAGSGVWETCGLLRGGDQPGPRRPHLLWTHQLRGESLCKSEPKSHNESFVYPWHYKMNNVFIMWAFCISDCFWITHHWSVAEKSERLIIICLVIIS